jgi:hypothetical protein
MRMIKVKNWYQLDFIYDDPYKDLLKIASLIQSLKKVNLVTKWFFLFEGKTIRVRMKGHNKNRIMQKIVLLAQESGLKMDNNFPFADYTESDEMLSNIFVILTFANIMSSVTQLTIKKLKKDTSFNNYRILERFQHCMFNNMLALKGKSEEYYLQQRLLERTRQQFDDVFDM